MLTATYSLVTIAAEQDKARGLLCQLQRYIQAAWKGMQALDFSFLETAHGKLFRLDDYWRKRKIEAYLIPSLRSAGREAEALISELDMLGAKCREIFRTISAQLQAQSHLGMIGMSETVHAMEMYCDYLFARFEKEEKELLPMARSLFSVEEWFAIAANFLSDGDAGSTRRRKPDALARVRKENGKDNARPAPDVC